MCISNPKSQTKQDRAATAEESLSTGLLATFPQNKANIHTPPASTTSTKPASRSSAPTGNVSKITTSNYGTAASPNNGSKNAFSKNWYACSSPLPKEPLRYAQLPHPIVPSILPNLQTDAEYRTFVLKALHKKIPGVPDNELPVHLRPRQIFSYSPLSRRVSDQQLELAEKPRPVLSWSEKRQKRKEWIQAMKDKKEREKENPNEKGATT